MLSVHCHICMQQMKQQMVLSVKVQMHLEESKNPQKAHNPKYMSV